jgi:ABC-type multidrug transport system fused ATPase/permease subunit
VGASGCGKSTLGALLTRLYDPCLASGSGSSGSSGSSSTTSSAGSIKLDGVDIRQLDPTWLRSQIAVVPQEPVLFATSIEANIRFGRAEASREEVELAARQASAHHFIQAFAQGYDTRVGERGAQLSGGQRQRVAIARAILKNAPILILDVSGGGCSRAPEPSCPLSHSHTHTYTRTHSHTRLTLPLSGGHQRPGQ